MKLEAKSRLAAAASDEDVTPTTAIAYERKQQSGKWTRRHVVVPSKDAATKLKSLKADPKVRNPKVVSASTTLECGCLSAKVCAHAVSALTEKQKKLDINKDGKIDADDLKKVREGELAEATMLSAATPKEAAQYVVKVFKKNGFNIKFSRNSSDPDILVFDMVDFNGKKFSFGLHLEGKTVSMDSLGEDVFDLSTFLADEVNRVNTKRLDFEKLGSAAFKKWEASTEKLAGAIEDSISRYESFVERFIAAIAEITAEMKKGKT